MGASASASAATLGLLFLLAALHATATTAFVLPQAATATGRGRVVTMATGESDRREALGRGLLLGGATAAALLGTTTPAPTLAAAGRASARKPLPPYPAKITSKAYLDVRITGFVTGQEKATNEEYVGRIVVGLFGEDAPLAVKEFLKYASMPYGGDAPSYAFSSFIKADPGVSVTAGRIKGLKEIELAGTKEYEWFDRVLGAQGLDEPKPALLHDRKGLLTKYREQDAVDPVFDITLAATPERDGRATVFGVVLEGLEALDEVGAVPVYTMEAAGGAQPEALDNVFVQQKQLFLNLAKTFGDERAVDRRGSFLKRVEVIGCGVL